MNARSRHDSIDKLSDQAAVILEHMIKVQCYPNHESVMHWRTEIRAQGKRLVRYVRGKKGAQNLKVKDFLRVIYEERIGDSPVLEILEQYGPFEVQPNIDYLKGLITEFAEYVINLSKIEE